MMVKLWYICHTKHKSYIVSENSEHILVVEQRVNESEPQILFVLLYKYNKNWYHDWFIKKIFLFGHLYHNFYKH